MSIGPYAKLTGTPDQSPYLVTSNVGMLLTVNRYALETLRRARSTQRWEGIDSACRSAQAATTSSLDLPEPPVLAVSTVEADRLDLRASGDFGPGTGAIVRNRLTSLINAGARHVVIDRQGIGHFSDDVAREFSSLEEAVVKLGGSLRFI